MKMIDPTYLRNIHDGLLSGTIHKDNASTLPIGLIGIYEEALPAAINVNERKKFLEFFAVWALLKKEVSAAFVVQLLEGWSEEQVLDYISKYIKWFNSPVSGKYVLYHERLRSFAIQKISQLHFDKCNDSIIENCQAAIQAKSDNDWEHYALEHLSLHLLIQALESKDAAALKNLAYDTTHWNRQVEISKGFEWSKRMLNDMMLWASKYDDDEVIECALNKVDLHHQEQNDAPQIVELVTQNDIETALQRIEAFGGNDKEGLQRKFILYMLCLMELTLLDGKDKPFCKEAIEKLLKHLDDNIPANQPDLINWNDFFPSYLMFELACELARMTLDYLVIYKRTNEWYSDWIKNKGPYLDWQFNILLSSTSNIDVRDKIYSQKTLELAKEGQLSVALQIISKINETYYRAAALNEIFAMLISKNQIKEALLVISQAINSANEISNDSDRSSVLHDISIELSKYGNVERALDTIRGISVVWWKCSALMNIYYELAKTGKLDELDTVMKLAIEASHRLIYDLDKIHFFTKFSTELAKQSKMEASDIMMQQAFNIFRSMKKHKLETNDDYVRHHTSALEYISFELAKQGKIMNALVTINENAIKINRLLLLEKISTGMAEFGNITEAFNIAFSIDEEYYKSRALKKINLLKENNNHETKDDTRKFNYNRFDTSKYSFQIRNYFFLSLLSIRKSDRINILESIPRELARNCKIEESIRFTRFLSDNYTRCLALNQITHELTIQNKIDKINLIVVEALKFGQTILLSSQNSKSIFELENNNEAIKILSALISEQGEINEAKSFLLDELQIINNSEICDAQDKYFIFKALVPELVKQELIAECLQYAKIAKDENNDLNLLKYLAITIAKNGLLSKAFEISTEIVDELGFLDNISVLNAISIEFAKKGKIIEALEIVKNINSESEKVLAFTAISTELNLRGNESEAYELMTMAIELVLGIKEVWHKNRALNNIATGFAKQVKPDEAIEYALKISDEWLKSSTLKGISSELFKQEKIEEAISLIEEAIECVRDISDENDKCSILKDISIELAIQGNVSLAEKTGLEISQIAMRYDCWKRIAEIIYEKVGWAKGLQQSNIFQNREAKKYYFKGFADLVKTSECNADLILSARQYYIDDLDSMEKLLRLHALHELFFDKSSKEKTERFNRTLKIRWAIDLREKLN